MELRFSWAEQGYLDVETNPPQHLLTGFLGGDIGADLDFAKTVREDLLRAEAGGGHRAGEYIGGEGYAVSVEGHDVVITSHFDLFPEARYPVANLLDALDQQSRWLRENLATRPPRPPSARGKRQDLVTAAAGPPQRLDDAWVVVALSLQQALLGMVTPSLRGIGVRAQDAAAQVRFVYEAPTLNVHDELVAQIRSAVGADLLGIMAVEFSVCHLLASTRLTLISDDERWFYKRLELPNVLKSTLRGFD